MNCLLLVCMLCYTHSGCVLILPQVMLGTLDNSVIVVDENEVEDQLLQDRIAAPIDMMALAPNGRFLACYRRDGILTVMSSNFTTKVCQTCS